ncbi:SDR family NAD(P)-dependent oxidoreductase [Tardiphaga sp. 215_C5_N2_1]|uniref:SDR family NAD(P)-dependent oxidoreductase n=1 Tax=Tardiphaga sp. 215_C5_N2_1 TaxID=3240774 RepID=UPI003F8B6D4E
MKISFDGRVALVTGASRGIGRATALALAEAGADVALSYHRDEKGARDTVAEIREMGRRSACFGAAVEKAEDNERLINDVIREFGSLSVLICNAGVAPKGRKVVDSDLSDVEHAFRVNALSPLLLAKTAIPHLRQQKRGDIVIVSSIATHNLRPYSAAYSMSKAAAEALARVLSKEEREHGIRCNIVAPGLTDTEMGKSGAKRIYGVGDIRELDASQPFGHVCAPEEVASTIVYLASGANSYTNGQRICVDGGG